MKNEKSVRAIKSQLIIKDSQKKKRKTDVGLNSRENIEIKVLHLLTIKKGSFSSGQNKKHTMQYFYEV